jgi:hypothetical protein
MNSRARPRQLPVSLTGPLQPDQEQHWPFANKDVVWGWKRDVGTESRAVYFSGTMGRNHGCVMLDRYFFHYRTKMEPPNSASFVSNVERARARFADLGDHTDLKLEMRRDILTVEFRFGLPTEIDEDRVRRLKLRRPRKRIPAPTLPPPVDTITAGALWPADLYVGSGLSYEAGLPTLCDMHDVFCVDNEGQDGFTVGSSDRLPTALAEHGRDQLAKFCRVHTMALFAEPTPAMLTIARLAADRKVQEVFTDNVDNLLSKTGVKYKRVRGSGVFNERYNVKFSSPRLIVVGVAADRRQIIRQARSAGLEVIVVNPCKKVSPNVMHLEYVRVDDVFFKCDAQRFFAKL